MVMVNFMDYIPDNHVDVEIQCLKCKNKKILKLRADKWDQYKNGESYVQTLFPTLSAGDRELLISKICEPCFDEMFG